MDRETGRDHEERKDLVVQLVFKTNDGRITPFVAGSIPALSANPGERNTSVTTVGA